MYKDWRRKYRKHLQVLMALELILACELVVYADPASIAISVAISVALTVAQIGLQMLFAPRPKTPDKNKIQGDLKLQSVGEGIPIAEVAGKAPPDGKGGQRVGSTIVWFNQIRDIPVTVQGGSSGGGKGGPKPSPGKEHHYYVDLACLVAGQGPYNVRQIHAVAQGADLLYQNFGETDSIAGTSYEAEARTDDSGAVADVADIEMSGSLKAVLDPGEWLEWNNVVGEGGTDPLPLYIVYKSTADATIELSIGIDVYPLTLPDSFGERAHVLDTKVLALGPSNIIRITNTSTETVAIDRLVVGYAVIFPDGDGNGCYLSGSYDPNWTNPEQTFDIMNLRPVYERDPRGCEQYNYQANPNTQGEIGFNLNADCQIRIYPGNYEQMPDPLLQEYFEARYGPGATPAYRGRCLVVFENLEITKWGTIPNFTFTIEHQTIGSVGEFFEARAKRVGLLEEEMDFSDLYTVPLRGYAIMEPQAPAREMEMLCRVFDLDVYESDDGKVVGVIPDETVALTIPVEDLGVEEEPGESSGTADKPFVPVTTTFRMEEDLPHILDATFFDPENSHEPANAHTPPRVSTQSLRRQNVDTRVVLTRDEGQKFVDRDLHRQYVEKDGLSIKTFPKYLHLSPTQIIQVTDKDGELSKMRIKTVEGWAPGVLDIRGVSRDHDEYPPRLFVTPGNPVLPTLYPPAPVIATFIDITTFREEQSPGFYVAAALTDTHYRWRGAGLYRETDGGLWEALDGIPNQATMGLTVDDSTVGRLEDPPGGYEPGDWDETNTFTADLYYGEPETLSREDVLQGRNYAVVGSELIQFTTATRTPGFLNRWTFSDLQRGLRLTEPTGHAESERFVVYTDAWRWIVQPPENAGVERTYKLVGYGGDVATAWTTTFNWQGRTQYNTPIYTTIDNGVPVLDPDAPTVNVESGSFWRVFIKRPASLGYSTQAGQVRIRKQSDDTVVRVLDVGVGVTDTLFAAPSVAVKIDYRWRNGYRLNGSDGWSAWSTVALADPGTPPPPPGPVNPGGGGDGPGDFPPVGGCFRDGTAYVWMADRSWKPIEQVKLGELVLAWNRAGRIYPSPVTGVHTVDVLESCFLEFDNDDFDVTGEHPFAPSFESKMRVDEMDAGQELLEYNRGWQKSTVRAKPEIVEFDQPTRHRTLAVHGLATYFVRRREGAPAKAVYNKPNNYNNVV